MQFGVFLSQEEREDGSHFGGSPVCLKTNGGTKLEYFLRAIGTRKPLINIISISLEIVDTKIAFSPMFHKVVKLCRSNHWYLGPAKLHTSRGILHLYLYQLEYP